MQKREKMAERMSGVVMEPVMEERWWMASRTSWAMKSAEIGYGVEEVLDGEVEKLVDEEDGEGEVDEVEKSVDEEQEEGEVDEEEGEDGVRAERTRRREVEAERRAW